MRKYAALLSLLALLALGACGDLPPERRLELVVTAGGYAPGQLAGQVGEQIFIRLLNSDTIAHSLSVELPSGTRTVSADPGKDVVLAISARDAGTFRLYCVIPGHTEQGTLLITAPAN